MNLNDIAREAESLKEKLSSVEVVVQALNKLLSRYIIGSSNVQDKIINVNFVGTDNTSLSRGREILNDTKAICNDISRNLQHINFVQPVFDLALLEDRDNKFGLNEFKNIYKSNYEIINEFIALNGKVNSDSLIRIINAIKTIVEEYYKIINGIDKIINTENLLHIKNEGIKVRFLNEDKTITGLIDNLNLIEEIYNSINIINNEHEKLEYGRIESGSLELDLIGNLPAITAMGGIIAFGYKVYSEQFSRKAKLEREKLSLECEELKLKIRGDYTRIIKESYKDNEIEISENQMLNILSEIETYVKKLFVKNPCIKINEEKVGLDELKDTELPIKLLDETSNKDSNNSQEEKTDK